MHFEKLLCNEPNPDVTQWTYICGRGSELENNEEESGWHLKRSSQFLEMFGLNN